MRNSKITLYLIPCIYHALQIEVQEFIETMKRVRDSDSLDWILVITKCDLKSTCSFTTEQGINTALKLVPIYLLH